MPDKVRSLTPKEMKAQLKPDFYKLYKLIWDRFVASQMENSVMEILLALAIVAKDTASVSASSF